MNLNLLGVRFCVTAFGTCLGDLECVECLQLLEEGQYTITFNSDSEPSWILVLVLRFCLSEDGKASGCEWVVISLFS